MKVTETPLIQQYREMKKKHPDAVLLFRVGDFYETFANDAVAASEILGITLTRRMNGSANSIELAGFPHHALDTYLPKLIRAGKRVAICEQLEDPKLSKKLVKRGITELVTPANQTKLPNGLIIGSKVEVGACGIHDANGRFKIHNGKVGIFLSENKKWYFAPLILSPEDEERYRLYTELSWKYSEWIWIDEYQEEKLPEYYEEMKALYQEFVSKYGFLNAPENESFILLDRYADNLDILEKKVVGKDGSISYIPGDGFEEIESSIKHNKTLFDFSSLISIFSVFMEILNKLTIFGEISRKTQEIRNLAKKLDISPKRAFEECNSMYQPYQPSLFD